MFSLNCLELQDIPGGAAAAESLRNFDMNVCPEVHDFDALKYLKPLKVLFLSGENALRTEFL
jgi:hypothetical protein